MNFIDLIGYIFLGIALGLACAGMLLCFFGSFALARGKDFSREGAKAAKLSSVLRPPSSAFAAFAPSRGLSGGAK